MSVQGICLFCYAPMHMQLEGYEITSIGRHVSMFTSDKGILEHFHAKLYRTAECTILP